MKGDFLLELLSEEIPARMQAKAEADLARLFAEQLAAAGLQAEKIETYSTPRRLALIARNLPAETAAVSEEIKGPRVSAPPQALEGFLRKTGLTREQLVERDGVFFALIDKPGRSTASVLAEAVPAVIRAFPWPKSMRWGEASASTESIRWVRPLQGIVALLGEEIVDFEVADVRSGAATVGHRFHHPGIITIGSANDYAEKLRACHVIIDPAERRRIIAEGARAAASAAGLRLVEDVGLLAENAGLTEWPVPLLGSFDPAFLDLPREVIQLTMRTNQKYFALLQSSPGRGGGPAQPVEGALQPHDGSRNPLHQPSAGPPPHAGEDQLAPYFICTANIEASDGGAAIVAGNEKVLAARLSDAKFFWEQDLKVPLEEQAKKLDLIVFHEKLGTVADKVERVAKLARWLIEEGIVPPSVPAKAGAQSGAEAGLLPSQEHNRADLAALAERAARLCKADLVTGMVGEFPELQGIIGGYLARAQGEPDAVADAIRDHYRPVGQGDEVPTEPVTVAVSLADKLDTIAAFFSIKEKPTGSKDPFALRRAILGIIAMVLQNGLRVSLRDAAYYAAWLRVEGAEPTNVQALHVPASVKAVARDKAQMSLLGIECDPNFVHEEFPDFLADRLKVQQREAGVRHDLIDAVFALGGEDDLVRLLARVTALQAFVETPEGTDLLAGYKRASNILKKEGYSPSPLAGEGGERGADRPAEPARSPQRTPSAADAAGPSPSAAGAAPPSPATDEWQKQLSYTPEAEEAALMAALDSAEPKAATAVEAEDFGAAMAALASLRAPVDAFFDKVTVNDPDPAKREARLNLLARMRAAVHRVADFSRIEG